MLFRKSKEKIRYAVIGLGHIAQSAVLPAFRHAKVNSKLVALVSGDKDKLQYLGEKYHITKRYLYSEFEEFLKKGEIDAVYVTTSNSHHKSMMEMAARYGVHVLCEKPMSVTTQDCQSMIREAKKNHIQLMVAYRLHFEAANLRVRQMAQTKRIGDLKVFNSIFTIQVKEPNSIRLEEVEKGGGPLHDIGIYCINAARHLFGSEPIEVYATSARSRDARFRKVDEVVSCILKFSEGRIANFTVSFGAFPSADYDLIGTKGRLRLERGYKYQSHMTLKIYEDKKTIIKKYSKRDQFSQEIVYFSNCVQNKKTPEPSGEEGLNDIKIIEALLLSIDLASPISIEEINRKVRHEGEPNRTKAPFVRPKTFQVNPSGAKDH